MNIPSPPRRSTFKLPDQILPPPSLIDFARHKKRVPLFSCGPSHVQASVKASLSRRVELLQARKTTGGSLPHTPISARFLQRRRREVSLGSRQRSNSLCVVRAYCRLGVSTKGTSTTSAPTRPSIRAFKITCLILLRRVQRAGCVALARKTPQHDARTDEGFFIVLHSVLRSCGTCDPRTLKRALFGVLSGLPTHHPGLSHMCTRRRPACPRRWTRMRWF